MAFDKSNETCSFFESKLKSMEVALTNKFDSLADQVNELPTKMSQSLADQDNEMATDTHPLEQEKQSSRLPPSLDEITASFSTMMTEQKERKKKT